MPSGTDNLIIISGASIAITGSNGITVNILSINIGGLLENNNASAIIIITGNLIAKGVFSGNTTNRLI